MFFHITAVISIKGYEPSSSSCYTVMSFFVSFCCLYMKKDTSYCPKLMLVVSSSGKNQKVKKVKKRIYKEILKEMSKVVASLVRILREPIHIDRG
jgi:hypothetical protein